MVSERLYGKRGGGVSRLLRSLPFFPSLPPSFPRFLPFMFCLPPSLPSSRLPSLPPSLLTSPNISPRAASFSARRSRAIQTEEEAEEGGEDEEEEEEDEEEEEEERMVEEGAVVE